MNCIVIDDEPLALEGMKMNLEKIDFVNVLGMFSNVIEASQFLSNNEIDLLLIDIEMPDITGLEFLKTLDKKPFTIFITAYPQYALEAFELGVVDYVLKPVSLPRLVQAINRTKQIFDLEKKKTPETMETKDDHIYVKSERQYVKLYFQDILYIKGLKDYVIFQLKDSKVLTAVNLKTLLKQIPENIFSRINKSYIVNVNTVTAVYSDVVVIGEEELVLSPVYREEFINKNIIDKLIKRKI